MIKTRPLAVELLAPLALALAIGLFVSVALAGAALLLASDTDAGSAPPEVPVSTPAAHA